VLYFKKVFNQVLAFVNLRQNLFVYQGVVFLEFNMEVEIQILLPILFDCPGSNHWFQSFQRHFNGNNLVVCTINKLLRDIRNFLGLIVEGLELNAAVISTGDMQVQV